jgi:uncharacterized protein
VNADFLVGACAGRSVYWKEWTIAHPHRYQFEVHGTTLAGNLFAPTRGQPRTCAVLTGPLTSVKEQAAGAYAAALAERGFLALAFDQHAFGESGGEPRQALVRLP